MLFSEFCKSFCAPICNSGCKIFLAEFEISDRSTTSSTKSHRFVLAAGPCCVCQMTAQASDAQQCCLLFVGGCSFPLLSQISVRWDTAGVPDSQPQLPAPSLSLAEGLLQPVGQGGANSIPMMWLAKTLVDTCLCKESLQKPRVNDMDAFQGQAANQ